MKRKITLLAVLVIVLAILAGSTLAYFTDKEVAHNVITSGGIDIEVDEWTDLDGDGEFDDGEEWPEEGFEDVTPNADISKIVSVTNLDSKSWIRVQVTVIIEKEVNGQTIELPLYLDDGTPVVTITGLDTTNWVYGDDGYWYYNTALAKDEETTDLFTGVHFSAATPNDYAHSVCNVYVYAEAVQADNNDIPDGGDVTDIEGWPGPGGTTYIGTPVDGDGKPVV